MKSNRYILALDNNYSHEKAAIEVFNISCDSDRYVFENPQFPEDLKFGTYDYRLFHCVYDNWEMIWRPDLNDSMVRIRDAQDNVIGTYRISDLKAESGMLEFRPDSPMSGNVVMESEGGIWLYGDVSTGGQ